jgi:hypothetical protein
MKSKRVLIAAIAAAFLAVSCTPTTTPASTTTSEVAVSTSTTSLLAPASPTLLDANGVELGTYLTSASFYSPDIKRIVVFGESDGRLYDNGIYFNSPGCSGAKYIDSRNSYTKNPYIYAFSNGLGGIYIVNNSTVKSIFKPSSFREPNGTCNEINPDNETERDFYEVERASPPFTFRLAFPFSFK